MKEISPSEHYDGFLKFVDDHIQRDRRRVSRRMWSVVLWSFILPAFVSAVILLAARLGWLPRSARNLTDVVILLFPIAYALYVLGSEVVVTLPEALRKGGISVSLQQSRKEGEWRRSVCDDLLLRLGRDQSLWTETVENFSRDLRAMEQRTRYLTALAGAGLFVILQAFDFMGDDTSPVSFVKTPQGWVELSVSHSEPWLALLLFLVLFYLSGSQTTYYLGRYLNCGELVLIKLASFTGVRKSKASE